MAITVTNLIQGVGTIHRGIFGSTEPTTAQAALDAAFIDLGATTDGVTLTINQEFSDLAMDQIVDIPGRRLVKRELTLSTNLAEATLANLLVVLNDTGAVTVPIAGTNLYTPAFAASVMQPTYSAVIFTGLAPGGFPRRVIARKVLSVDNTSAVYKKDGQTVFNVTFSAHFVTSAIAPFVIIDQVS